MKKLLACFAVIAAVSLTSSVASAALVTCDSLVPPAGGPTLVTGAQLGVGGSGCIEGGLTFLNFDVKSVPAGMTASLQAASAAGGTVNLGFQIGGFTLITGTADLQLVYEVKGTNITGVDNIFGGTAGSSIAETVCSSLGVFGGTCVGGQTLASFSNNNAGGDVHVSFAPQTDIWIIKDITAAISPGITSITVSGLTNSHETSGVPEPMTLSMMGVGLLGLSLISRRRKKN